MSNQPSPLLDSIHHSIEKKVALVTNQPLRYLLRSTYAGLYLALGSLAGAVLANSLYPIHPALAKIAFAGVFPIGLVMIIFLNAELATSNMMYASVSAHQGWITWPKAARLIGICTFGNLIGACLLTAFLSLTSTSPSLDPQHFILTTATSKLAKPLETVFFDGILANIFVNIAIVGQLRLKEEFARIFFMFFVIFLFIILGYDHVIANFGLFTQAILAGADYSWTHLLAHWGLSFLGNYIGGGLVIGLAYSWLNSNQKNYLD